MGRPRVGNVAVTRRIGPRLAERLRELEAAGCDLGFLVILGHWVATDPHAREYLPEEFWQVVKAARRRDAAVARARVSLLASRVEGPQVF